MQMPPGSESPSNRAAMLTPSPSRSAPSTTTSPTWMPMRNCIGSAGPRGVGFGGGGFRPPARRYRALDRIDRAGEIGDDAVPRGVEDPAAMPGDQAVDDGAGCFELRHRTG